MRIITEQMASYLQALALTIGKDPASLEYWRCIRIHAKTDCGLPTVAWRPLVDRLSEEFKTTSCDVVPCADSELLIIGQVAQLEAMQKLQERLFVELGAESEQLEWQVHDLFYGWREIRNILLAKVLDAAAVAPAHDDTADFGETASLSEVFNAAKKLQPARQPLHILLVEDDEMTRRLVTSLFKQNYVVFTAHDAHEALAQYLMHAPDIVFLDINLPDHNGFQVLQTILAHDPGAYVVMFSGNNYLDNITHALGAGAAGFVAKPFSKEKMRHYIEDCAWARQAK